VSAEVRWAGAARACYGAVLLLMPGRVIAAATGRAASRRACVVARVLGARHLAQAVVCGLLPTRPVIAAGATADELHAASMLALSAIAPGVRRAVLADAVTATALAAAGEASLRRDPAAGGWIPRASRR
jgi:hypothetical protein